MAPRRNNHPAQPAIHPRTKIAKQLPTVIGKNQHNILLPATNDFVGAQHAAPSRCQGKAGASSRTPQKAWRPLECGGRPPLLLWQHRSYGSTTSSGVRSEANRKSNIWLRHLRSGVSELACDGEVGRFVDQPAISNLHRYRPNEFVRDPCAIKKCGTTLRKAT
jgi:hypothetical protein